MAGWHGDYTALEISVRDADGGKPLDVGYYPVQDEAGEHSSFVFETPLEDSQLRIHFNTSNLSSPDCVGIDNIVFSQVPESSALTLLLVGGLMIALRRRRG